MAKLSNELKTGAVIVLALVTLAVILTSTGDLSFGKKGYTVKARFESAMGVKKFAPIRLAGVEVGEVRGLRMIYEPDKTWVEAELWVQEGTKLRKDSVALVG